MSRQLTEEQIWEEVETWVNSLVEEGYDLSDYTWEDMYEVYVNESWAALGGLLARGGKAIWQGAKPVAKKVLSQLGKFGVAGAVGLTADELLTRGAGRELVGKALQQTRKLGPALRGEPTDSVGTAKPKPSGETGQIISAAGGKGGKVTVGKEYAATLGGKKGTVKYDPSGKKSFTAQLNASYEYDAFDLILEYLASQGHVETLDEALYVMMEMDGEVIQDIVSEAYNNIIVSHLLDEGYAETPEAAEVIMVNMSEDWRESIVEDGVTNVLKGFGYPGAIAAYGLNRLSGGRIAKPDLEAPAPKPKPKPSTSFNRGGAGGLVTTDKEYRSRLGGVSGNSYTDDRNNTYFKPDITSPSWRRSGMTPNIKYRSTGYNNYNRHLDLPLGQTKLEPGQEKKVQRTFGDKPLVRPSIYDDKRDLK